MKTLDRKGQLPMRTPKSNKGFDEFVEQFFDFVLTTDSIAKLAENDAFSITLRLAAPATAKRLVASALQQCAQRGEPLPIRLAEIAKSYLVSETTRNRVRRRDEIAKAAAYQAKFPQASLRAIARIAGVDHTVVRDWQRQYAYKREMVKWLIPIAQQSYRKYVERFGSPFAEAGLPEPEGLRLARLRAIIEDALSRGVPADLLTANAALDASSGRSPPAIPI
jgi:hypothetical protein